jgi:hypothetical protein
LRNFTKAIGKQLVRILLIQPPHQNVSDGESNLQSLGLRQWQNALKKHFPAFAVHSVDLCGPVTLTAAYREGLMSADLLQESDLVVLTGIRDDNADDVLQVLSILKAKAALPILVTGSHVTADPFTYLTNANVDFILRSEKESILVAFLNLFFVSRLGGIAKWPMLPGLGYKNGAELIVNTLKNFWDVSHLCGTVVAAETTNNTETQPVKTAS